MERTLRRRELSLVDDVSSSEGADVEPLGVGAEIEVNKKNSERGRSIERDASPSSPFRVRPPLTRTQPY